MKTWEQVTVFLIILCIPALWVYKELQVIDEAVERKTCEASLELEVRRNDQLLSGGRFIRKIDKYGQSSYRFYVPPDLQKKAKRP